MGEVNIMEPLEAKKTITRWIRESKQEAKPAKCILCGRDQSSFCNSHSIPQFVLSNIGLNGKLTQFSAVVSDENILLDKVTDTEKGVKNSGTFQLICRECDSKMFSEYENKDNLEKRPSDKMMAEIELKNLLMALHKRSYELKLYQKTDSNLPNLDASSMVKICERDIEDYLMTIEKIKKIISGQEKMQYKIIYWKKLRYKAPIACQTQISLYKSPSGKIINDIYNMESTYKLQNIQLCVFPLENETIVMLFCMKTSRRYELLVREFQKMSASEQLQYICYLMFENTENIMISPHVDSTIVNSKALTKVSQELQGIPNLGAIPAELAPSILALYTPVKWNDVPNLLDKKYAVE